MLPKFKNTPDLLNSFPTEQSYIKYLERRLSKKNTGKYFSAKTGTVFESTKLPLWKWFYIFINHKKGISSHQLARDINITQKSVWFMLHRLRLGFKSPFLKLC